MRLHLLCHAHTTHRMALTTSIRAGGSLNTAPQAHICLPSKLVCPHNLSLSSFRPPFGPAKLKTRHFASSATSRLSTISADLGFFAYSIGVRWPNATLAFSSTQVTGFPIDIADFGGGGATVGYFAGSVYLQIFRHLHLCSAYAWTADVFDIVGPLVGQTTTVVESQKSCGDVWTMW